MEPMRIATWNVNSLNARLPKVLWWLERAKPDVLLMQETKLADDAVPSLPFREAGYALAHHGQGRWNGVAIASRCGIDGVIENFGKPLSRPAAPDVDDVEPLAEARMISAVCGGVRVLSLYAPNGREVGSPSYVAKLCGSTTSPAGWKKRTIQGIRSRSAVTTTLLPKTSTFGILARLTAERMCRRPNGRRWCGFAVGAWWTRIDGITRKSAGIPGGTIAPGIFTRTAACASITCSSRSRSASARFGRKSIVKRAKANPPPPITPLS